MKPNRGANPNTQKNKRRLDAAHYHKLCSLIADIGVVLARKRLSVSTETMDELRSPSGFGVNHRVVNRVEIELDKNESTQEITV